MLWVEVHAAPISTVYKAFNPKDQNHTKKSRKSVTVVTFRRNTETVDINSAANQVGIDVISLNVTRASKVTAPRLPWEAKFAEELRVVGMPVGENTFDGLRKYILRWPPESAERAAWAQVFCSLLTQARYIFHFTRLCAEHRESTITLLIRMPPNRVRILQSSVYSIWIYSSYIICARTAGAH